MLPHDPSKPSDSLSPSEISALGESSFRRGSRLSRALAARTPAFRLYWTLFTVVVLGYIVANSSGYLSGYLAFGWTGQFFDLQMHMRMPKPAITDTAIIVAISISERPELSSVVLELVLVLVLEVEAEDV